MHFLIEILLPVGEVFLFLFVHFMAGTMFITVYVLTIYKLDAFSMWLLLFLMHWFLVLLMFLMLLMVLSLMMNMRKSTLELVHQLGHDGVDRDGLVVVLLWLGLGVLLLMVLRSSQMGVMLEFMRGVELWHYTVSMEETMVMLVGGDGVKSWVLLVGEVADAVRRIAVRRCGSLLLLFLCFVIGEAFKCV